MAQDRLHFGGIHRDPARDEPIGDPARDPKMARSVQIPRIARVVPSVGIQHRSRIPMVAEGQGRSADEDLSAGRHRDLDAFQRRTD